MKALTNEGVRQLAAKLFGERVTHDYDTYLGPNTVSFLMAASLAELALTSPDKHVERSQTYALLALVELLGK